MERRINIKVYKRSGVAPAGVLHNIMVRDVEGGAAFRSDVDRRSNE